MKTLGLIGGLSWESTIPYYHVHQSGREASGSADCIRRRLILYSVDFDDIEQLMHAGNWDGAGAALATAARSLEAAGAQGLVLCTNTLHKVAAGHRGRG